MKTKSIYVMLIVLFLAGTNALAGETFYVSTADGHVLGLNGMTPGWSYLGGAGDTTFANVVFDWDGVQSITSIAVGNAGSPDGLQVVVGSTTGNVTSYNSNLSSRLRNWDTNGGGSDPVTRIAVGSIGSLPYAVAVASAWGGGGAGGGGSSILIGDYTLAYRGHTGFGTDTTGLAIGELDTARAGNEVLATATNMTTKLKSSSAVLGAAYDTTAGQNVANLWSFSPSNTVSNVVMADLWPGVGAGDDFAILGNIGAYPDGRWGDGAQGYTANISGAPDWKWWSNLDRDPVGTVVAGAAGDIFGNSGLEIAMVGNSTLYIIDADASGQAGTLQAIGTGQPGTSVLIADVLRGDGVDEIVIGMANGVIFAYEHADLGDMNSGFALNPDAGIGGIFVMGNWSEASPYSVTGLAIPEPATMVLVSLGGLIALKRRRA